MIWFFIFAAALLLSAVGILFIAAKLYALPPLQKLSAGRPRLARLLSLLSTVLIAAIVFILTDFVNGIIILLHFLMFLLLCSLAGGLIRRLSEKRPGSAVLLPLSAVLTVCWLACGWYWAHDVHRTEYKLNTDEIDGSFRIVFFADSHIGTTFDADGFAGYLQEISEEKPDAVFIVGDLVDDSTSRSDMLAGCKALSNLQPEDGVYYVYGNHDKGYSSAGSRGWTADELRDALLESGVVILEDESVSLENGVRISGRKDASYPRLSPAELLGNSDFYDIVLDHQPREYRAESDAGADLVLSGHTHGGQLIPITYAGQWMGMNDSTYGKRRIGGTEFIVTSGIGDWAIWFKTGCRSEYVVIDINP